MMEYLVIVTLGKGNTNKKLIFKDVASDKSDAVVLAMEALNDNQKNDVENVAVMKFESQYFDC